ncbi:MAG: hypothetical protein GOVbin4551_2 [Prokaryotic dsDNA virus sp.]|nr:MAG: hypothetical protein GOVbin4551_2 [Prokaryotic dsDNA virus sp.]|tara:strand:- start:888 stop:1508 length:621 start_codon:yes stop_codon:yes gene_type:complete
MKIEGIKPIGFATEANLVDNANNVAGADYVYACNNLTQVSTSVKMRFVHIVSSDFALPALSARTTGSFAVNNTDANNFDNLTTGGDAFATGLQVHGGGFGLTHGTTAVISVLANYTGNSDNAATFTFGVSAGGTAVAYPETLANNTRLFFGNLTGKYIASFSLPPNAYLIFKKDPLQKVFSTPGIHPTSGSSTTSAGVFFTRVALI